MDDYLSKPVRLETLREMITRWMPEKEEYGKTQAEWLATILAGGKTRTSGFATTGTYAVWKDRPCRGST